MSTQPHRWNEYGVAQDPNLIEITIDNLTYVQISTAMAPDGSWRYGYWFQIKGVVGSIGGPSIHGEPYRSEDDARRSGLLHATEWLGRDYSGSPVTPAVERKITRLEGLVLRELRRLEHGVEVLVGEQLELFGELA